MTKEDLNNTLNKYNLMVLYPFKTKNQQVSFGFAFGLGSLVIIAIGLNKSLILLNDITLGWPTIGGICFLISLFYFIEGLN